ncbi:Crp/Fnr family transcriptional regulator [Pedobacter sp. SYP-B3415]|uniref:Crp/Fnr family transcriptional regulator n=1 Tax=Pedobacter sp. SYP-B3415 TaxID=2496641 RepID=UPI00101B7C1C|nr:Crp/Fnr family transcriptional regulator [Pedobacter sp. SYP-B3415]
MHDAYFDYLKKFTAKPLTSDERALIRQHFRPYRLRKKQYLLQAGEICHNYGFIVKGAMRMYTVDDKEMEHIVRLGIENWWMGDRESFINQTPSRYNIDALEHCELLCLTLEGSLALQKNVPAFVEMKFKLDERNEMANNRRVTSAISDPANKRYADLLACYPEFAQRFPQHVIASYLGINKDTLSRIKRQIDLK